jgi:hypothetical protein
MSDATYYFRCCRCSRPASSGFSGKTVCKTCELKEQLRRSNAVIADQLRTARRLLPSDSLTTKETGDSVNTTDWGTAKHLEAALWNILRNPIQAHEIAVDALASHHGFGGGDNG